MEPDLYSLILFDVDDTLLDFGASEDRALELCWDHYFREVSGFEHFRLEFKVLNLQIWKEVESGKLKPDRVSLERARRALTRFGLNTRHAEKLGQMFSRGLSEVARWLPLAENAFKKMAARYKVGLVTNGLSGVQHPRINALGIRPLLSAFQISEEAGSLKPRAEIFFLAIKEAGEDVQRILMVGDSLSSDYQGSINAGIDFCWVKPNDSRLPSFFPKPRYHVSSLAELDSLLP